MLESSAPEPGPEPNPEPEPLTLCAGVGRVDCVVCDPCVAWFDCVDCIEWAAEVDDAKEDDRPPPVLVMLLEFPTDEIGEDWDGLWGVWGWNDIVAHDVGRGARVKGKSATKSSARGLTTVDVVFEVV